MRRRRAFAAAMSCLLLLGSIAIAGEPKQGGIFRIYHRDSPGSASIHEGATNSINIRFMPVFNNLVIYDQHIAQNSLDDIRPELAESWAWSADKKTLTFKLRQGVKWHDGKPFTSADVKCTFDMLMGKSQQRFRQNPRKTWYDQVNDVTTNGDYEASFNLKRLQPSLLALLASGYTPVYSCHVSPGDMRTKPVGTGPFKFVEFKANELIKLVKNPDYWKKGLPYLDGIEFNIITNRSTAVLGFISGKFDMTFPTEVTIPLLKDVKSQAPNAVCVLEPNNVSTNIIVNSSNRPFDNIDVRRALALALDRKAFIQIQFEGQADIGGTMQPGPAGLWAMPKEMLETIPGYGPDIEKNRDEARKLMQKAGFGPDKRLQIKIATRAASPPRWIAKTSDKRRYLQLVTVRAPAYQRTGAPDDRGVPEDAGVVQRTRRIRSQVARLPGVMRSKAVCRRIRVRLRVCRAQAFPLTTAHRPPRCWSRSPGQKTFPERGHRSNSSPHRG